MAKKRFGLLNGPEEGKGVKEHVPMTLVGYDYSTAEAREVTVNALYQRAKDKRTAREIEWEKCNDYYNGIHDATAEVREYAEEAGIPWLPAAMPDPWILVESQVDPNVPEPEFRGRDKDQDSKKAKQREYAVKYISENNRLSDMNTRNERRLLKYGDAFWKAYWDVEMRCGKDEGDIRIRDLPVDSIYPDPSVRDGTIQDGQYLDYVYRVHKVRFAQMFKRDLERLGITADELYSSDYTVRDGLFDMTTSINDEDDTVQVLEHWFKQPCDVEEDGRFIPAGSVGCSIQAGGREIHYIPDYWEHTHDQCRLFPFVHYWRIQDENQIWNKSELFPVLDLIDAADRKLAMSVLSDAMMANDIILVEEGALADGEEITNEPGSVIRVKPNHINQVRRLGGVQSIANSMTGVEWFRGQIERASRNYETNRGKEAMRTNTATGLAMIRADADAQSNIKKADRNLGFERLYELLDWLALEFFDDDRLIFLGADEQHGREAVSFEFNSANLAETVPPVLDMNGEVVREEWTYWPKVDVTITAGDSVVKGKQATLEALQVLTQSQITEDNWKLFSAQLDILDVPGKQDIVEEWRKKFEPPPAMPGMPGMDMGAAAPGMPGGMGAAPGGMPGEPVTVGGTPEPGVGQSLPSSLSGIPTML